MSEVLKSMTWVLGAIFIFSALYLALEAYRNGTSYWVPCGLLGLGGASFLLQGFSNELVASTKDSSCSSDGHGEDAASD